MIQMDKKIYKVARVLAKDKIVINGGYEAGFKLGDRVKIIGIGEEIIDPDTQESLGHLELVKGNGKLIHVQEKISTVSCTDTYKEPDKRTVRKETGTIGTMIAFGRVPAEIENITPGQLVHLPFDNVVAGDLVIIQEE